MRSNKKVQTRIDELIAEARTSISNQGKHELVKEKKTYKKKDPLPPLPREPEPVKIKRPPAEYSNLQYDDMISEILSRKIWK